MSDHWPVLPWPQVALPTLTLGIPLVVAVDTPETFLRGPARAAVRSVLREILGAHLSLVPEAVPLHIEPGHPPSVDAGTPRIGLGIAHEAGLSLVALHLGDSLGVDLMQVTLPPDWKAVSQQYLGPSVFDELAQCAPPWRAHAFAQAWTRHEAILKCIGERLTEWTPTMETRMAGHRTWSLALPPHYAGTLAVPA